MDHTIINHMEQVMKQVFEIKPVIKTFIIAIEIEGRHSEHRVKAESLSQAESNLMKFLGVNSCTFPDSRELS